MNRSTLQVLGCYILWGLLPVFWKLLAGVNADYVLAQRVVISCLFCYAFIWRPPNIKCSLQGCEV